MRFLLMIAALVAACSDADLDRVFDQVVGDQNMRIVRNPAALHVPCPDGELWAVAGQSNAAGSAEDPGDAPASEVVQFHNGRCYSATAPLFGASSMPTDGKYPAYNPFLRVAQEYSARTGRAVILRFISVGGTSISRWSDPNDLGDVLANELKEFATLAPVDRVFWQQGETDAIHGMSAAEYRANLERVLATIRAAGFSRQVHVARSSRCYGIGPDNPVGAVLSVYGGADTDALGQEFRHDGCHFSAEGVRAFAALWLSAIGVGG